MRSWARSAVLMLVCFVMACAVMHCGDKDDQKADSEQDTKADSTQADTTQAEEDTTGQAEKKKKEEEKEEETVPVRAVEVRLSDISSYLLFSSTVEVEHNVDVYAQGMGLVEQVNVEEGHRVRKDQILAELDDDEARLTEAKARVALKKLRSDFARIKDLYEKDLTSKERYENAAYQIEEAEIEWKRTKLVLDHTKIRASIPGVISERMVKLGDRVQPSTKLFSIVDTDNLLAKVYIPGKDAGSLRPDQRAVVTTDFMPDANFSGWIERISPVVDPNSGTFKVTVGIHKGNEDRLKPGMFVNVRIITDTHRDVPVVPKNAIVYDGGLRYIFVVRDSIAAKELIEPGFSERDSLEVLSGVTAGDSIIVVGQEGLKDRAKVKVVAEDLLPPSEKKEEEEEKNTRRRRGRRR
ncbi:MAG: efflux RND transporter periplasmic adaptor subunit [Candidatus Latescibacteria bacterium]|nr:efflux RND transporter periplasmic adaptor subunit [Candidatus Latescibacterota bacterium]MCK5525560.1 efflux RND transporter periplasmic adaptor subunit [Candidatus Latescibacterota bacterium]MCK5732677.1 efflux RND transporter periplasmic adaptor subunit [Candidatus Latescibacterota bacterium]